MRPAVLDRLGMLRSALGKSAPYVIIELLVPGGTLIALLLYLYERRVGRPPALIRWINDFSRRVSVTDSAWRLAWPSAGRERDGLEVLQMLPVR